MDQKEVGEAGWEKERGKEKFKLALSQNSSRNILTQCGEHRKGFKHLNRNNKPKTSNYHFSPSLTISRKSQSRRTRRCPVIFSFPDSFSTFIQLERSGLTKSILVQAILRKPQLLFPFRRKVDPPTLTSSHRFCRSFHDPVAFMTPMDMTPSRERPRIITDLLQDAVGLG